MISKGYHYVINVGIVGNFCISIDPACAGSCARGSIVAVELKGIWVFLSRRSSCPLSTISFYRA